MTTEIKFSARSVGHMALQLLVLPIDGTLPEAEQTRLTNKEILESCLANFPEAKTTPACIAWYSSKLKNDPDYRAKHGGKLPLPPRKIS